LFPSGNLIATMTIEVQDCRRSSAECYMFVDQIFEML
jgi:hypothetical protein